MEIVTEVVAINTTGGAGVSAGTGRTPAINGYLLDIYLDYHASAPATADVTIAYADLARGNILVVTNSATDALYMPRKQACDSAGAAVAGVYDLFPVNGVLSIAVAQSNDLTPSVTAYVRYLRVA